jgi:xanthine dehydrogenase accessory factor
MRDLLNEYQALLDTGQPVGRAVVTSVWGSAPRPEGACLLATADGRIAGSVSGGCVESATAQEIAQAIARGNPKLVSYGVSDDQAWKVGLACGGTIKVFVEPCVREEILDAASRSEGTVIATVLDGPSAGQSQVMDENGKVSGGSDNPWLAELLARSGPDALLNETSRTIAATAPESAGANVFLEVFPRQPRLVIVGAVHIAMALVPLARMVGYRTYVMDGRAAFLTRERFPEADELVLEWPAKGFEQIGIDRGTYICVLSHDPKFDEPAMELALRSSARYIGAIGSKKTQAGRRQRLLGLGFSEQDLARLHGPIGLDIGGRAPAETALSILAEMTAVRYGRDRPKPAG